MTQVPRLVFRAASIRVRLTLWYVALLAVILVLFSGVLYLSLARGLAEEMDISLSGEASRLLASMEFDNGVAVLGDGPDNPRIGTIAALYDASGQQLIAYDPRQPLPRVPEVLAQAAGGQETFVTASLPDGSQWRLLTLPVTDSGRELGILQVARPMAEVNAVLQQLALVLAVVVPITLLLASAGGLFLAGRAWGRSTASRAPRRRSGRKTCRAGSACPAEMTRLDAWRRPSIVCSIGSRRPFGASASLRLMPPTSCARL